MRTIIFMLSFFILVTTLQQCNNTDPIVNTSPVITQDTIKTDDPIPCCNDRRPSACDPPNYLNINTECSDVQVTCVCCQQIWDYYNGILPKPENIPCNIVNVAGCYETKH